MDKKLLAGLRSDAGNIDIDDELVFEDPPMKRALLNDVLLPIPEGPLFHYTSQAGLLGIVKNEEIWATHTQYLNDRQEYRHARELALAEIAVMMGEYQGEKEFAQLNSMRMALDRCLESINVCVCSFSEVADSLSQWRAYGSATGGYAIGFAGQYLKKICGEHKFHLVKCIYDEAEQRACIRALLEEVLEQHMQTAQSEYSLPFGGTLGIYLHRYAPILKHSAFREEREWRIITRPLMCSVGIDQFDYREGRSMIVPFYRVPLKSQNIAFEISEVVVGPTPHVEQACRSVLSLLAAAGLAGQVKNQVRPSVAPFRNW